jgi:hypothetical protein
MELSQAAVFLTACQPSDTVTGERRLQTSRRTVSGTALRSFRWWFAIGALLTLSVLMVQGGVRDLLDGTTPGSGASAYLSFGTTIFGGGLLAGCLALVMNRLR